MNPRVLGRCDLWQFVDHPEVCAGELCPRLVEFVEEACECVVAGVAGSAEDADANDLVSGLGDDVGVGLEERAQVASWALFLALGLRDGGHHVGLGPAGDHADEVEQQFLALGEGAEGLVPRP